MKDLHKDVGCSLWLGALLVAIFAAEWVLLRLLFVVLADRVQILATVGVIVLTILGGWVAVYRRVQRCAGRNRSLRRSSERQERGESLIELLIAVGIISMTLVVFIMSLSTGAMGVGLNTRRTMATTLASSQLEAIKASAYITSGAYAPITGPDGYTILIDTAVISTGLQQVTTTVRYDGQVLAQISNYKMNR